MSRSRCDAIAAAGLVVIQDRETAREVRMIRPSAHSGGEPIVELVVDRVDYRSGERLVRHREVELEVIHPDGDAALPGLVASLCLRFEDQLRPWSRSKLETGAAIAALIAGGSMEHGAMCDEQGNLRPDAYDRLLEIDIDGAGKGRS